MRAHTHETIPIGHAPSVWTDPHTGMAATAWKPSSPHALPAGTRRHTLSFCRRVPGSESLGPPAGSPRCFLSLSQNPLRINTQHNEQTDHHDLPKISTVSRVDISFQPVYSTDVIRSRAS